MRIRFEREEVEEIVRDYTIAKFGLDMSDKQCTMSGYYGGIDMEITDRQEERKNSNGPIPKTR